uniref:Uncharacterized protein n=1 Tax=Setaria digitata TaxID=48799 RepID=A0A915Q2A0_9BILA
MQRFKQYLIRYNVWLRCGDELEPAFAFYGDNALQSGCDNGCLRDVQEIIEKFRFAWGVPKIRTCQATCYQKVHELTNFMKSKIMAYNPYIGEKQSTNVKFEDDPLPSSNDANQSVDDETSTDRTNGKRIIELGIPRPTWFKPKFVDSSVPRKQ